MKLLLLLAIMAFKTADAGFIIMPPQQAPDGVPYEEGCWNPALNKYMREEESVSPVAGICMEHTCGVDGYIRIYWCPSFGGNCEIGKEDPNAAFPKCCQCEDGQIGYGVE